jgi:hypothetical protein
MTKKHFQALANALQSQSKPLQIEHFWTVEDLKHAMNLRQQFIDVCVSIAAVCRRENTAFRSSTFYEACGLTQEEYAHTHTQRHTHKPRR